ncbi:MAG TPA: ABC transporter ATP-binding protein [Balneolales bacterium]|nr:ABC transporter ATP-binding protein [Balneolales bacterium]
MNATETNQGILVDNLCKSFGGNQVLDHITLQLDRGNTYGLVGNNGAGKSTLINLLCDLLKSDSGTIRLLGKSYSEHEYAIKKQLGVLTEDVPLQESLTAYDYLRFVGMLYGLDSTDLRQRIDSLFEYFFDDPDDLQKRCGDYSTGMQKKLGVIAAVLHKPDLLLLDEPFSGLDPSSSRQMIDFLKAYGNEQRIVLVSSHNLTYLQEVISSVLVLHDQEILFQGTLEDFTDNGENLMEQKLFNMLSGKQKNLNQLSWLMDR